MSSNIFVATIDLSLSDRLKKGLLEQGFELSTPAYTIFSGKKPGITCTLYQSGKLTVQGKEMASFIEFYLEPEILQNFSFTHQEIDLSPRIGIDESGKGDFFGPLCIAGVFAEGEAIAKLKHIGVRDSKALSDQAALKIAYQIRKEYLHQIVRISPAKYNELYAQFKNLNHLLAWGHATAIEQLILKSSCKSAIIDQFASEHVVINALKRKNIEIQLTQRHRGEEDLVVAAASILARAAFLEGLDKLSEEIGIKLPKGASQSTINVGKQIVSRLGPESLVKVAKMHFKTARVILNKDFFHE